MNEQPEALRLAHALDDLMGEETLIGAVHIDKASYELRRLHAENEKLRKVPKWFHCDTHGQGNLNAWGCPECVRELRNENERLRDAVKAEREACAKICETGADCEHPTVKGYVMQNFGASTHLAAAIRARNEQEHPR